MLYRMTDQESKAKEDAQYSHTSKLGRQEGFGTFRASSIEIKALIYS